jgi:Concanavalin A-like lectin/glucanases superfamily/Immunoglobulin domain
MPPRLDLPRLLETLPPFRGCSLVVKLLSSKEVSSVRFRRAAPGQVNHLLGNFIEMKRLPLLLIANFFLSLTCLAQDLGSGLVGRYHLDGTGQDLSSEDNPLVLYNVQTAVDRSGNPNGAVYLDGVTSWMATSKDSSIFGSSPRTVSVWIKSDNFSFYRGNPVLIGLGRHGGQTVFDLSLGSSGTNDQSWSTASTARVFVHGGNLDAIGTTYPVTSDVWIHLVASSNGTLGSVKFYMNGSRLPSALGHGNATQSFSTTKAKMRISSGSDSSGPSNNSGSWWNQGFKGSLDDIRVYNRQLTDSEVTSLYEQPSTATGSPSFFAHPESQTLWVGQALQLSAKASGSAPLSYQWLKNGAVIAGATTAIYSVASATIADSGTYAVVVSNAYGSVYSNAATVTVAQPAAPTITQQPQSVTAFRGSSATLSVEATGTPSPSFQWLKSGVPLTGATSRTLSFASLTAANAGTYSVVVSNSLGTVASSTITLTVAATPAITSHPAGQSLLAGQTLQLSVVASGSAPLSYQWLKNGSVITGATDSTYSVPNASASDSGAYSVLVSNPYGSTYSTSAAVTVTQAVSPSITVQPQSVIVTSGSPVSISVEATGTPLPSYQWLKSGVPITGATSRILSFASASAATTGTYSVAVSNALGTVVSSAVVITVNAPIVAPTIITQPVSQVATAGTTVTLSATANGNPAPVFQWLRNGIVIPGATTSSLIISSAASLDAGLYYVIATNSAGSVTSSTANLAVHPSNALVNLSVRTTLAAGQTLIVGGVVSGGSKPILLRAAGPALNKFGLSGITDPRIELYVGQAPVNSNDNWPSALAGTFSKVGAFSFDVGSGDAALSQSLNGGFTVHAKGAGAGAVLVEAYDSGSGVVPRMINLSARTFVGTGSDILIAGFSLSGTGTKQLLVRAVGPTLDQFGVPYALSDPRVAIFASSGAVIAENNDWNANLSGLFEKVGAFALATGSRDAALLVTLSAGASYTVQVSGVNNVTGEALVEIYEVF